MRNIATNPTGLHVIFAMLVAVFLAGCADERVVQVTREADNRQAEQNQVIAKVVNDETAVRQQVAKLQNDLRADQAGIARERDQLEAERRQIAGWRQWAELYTPLLEALGVVAVIVCVLGYCGILAHSLRNNGPADTVLAESLVDQILSVEQLPFPVLSPDTLTQQRPAATAIVPRSTHV